MAASSSKGVKICLVKDGATGNSLTPTAASKAKPAVITVADVTGIVAGDVIKLPAAATGLSEIDGKDWIVGSVDSGANTFTLLGSDTTASTGAFAAGTMTHYGSTDMVCLCLSSLSFNPEEATSVSVATFCDPTASIPGAVVGAGTVDIAGYVDVTSADYQELLKASLASPAHEYTWRILLPGNGYITFPATIGTLNWDIPLEGAIGYSGTFALGSKPRHLF